MVYDVGVLGILGFFCALLGAYQGQEAGAGAALLVLLAYGAGTRRHH